MANIWGSIPEWLAGAGAVIALIFARSAAIAARSASDSQSEQLEHLRAEEAKRDVAARRLQASQVALWVSLIQEEGDQAGVKGINASGLPVYNMLVSCWTPVGVTEVRRSYVGPRPERRTLRGATQQLRELVGTKNVEPLLDRGELRVSCAFRDASGLWWYRTYAGELCEAKSQDEAEAGCRKPPAHAP